MYHNVEVDWKSFEYIFSGRTQYTFEYLAYILFCHEFNQETGMFRYFNQAGIETEPIEFDNQVIGFQAKYYDASTKISDRVSEFQNMVDKATQKNFALTKIIVYVNKELSESSNKERKIPKYQADIENYAKVRNVRIEWRVPSHIERMLFLPEIPEYIRDFFFNPQKGIRQFIEQNRSHSETLVETIDNLIEYESQELKTEYTDSIFSEFLGSDQKHLLIYGDSGTGKSGFIKSFYTENYSDIPIFVYKATDFGFNTLSEFSRQFGDCSLDDFFSAFDDSKNKIIIIDSAEKIFSMPKEVLGLFLNKAVKHNWKIVHTIRLSYKGNYISYVLKDNDCSEKQLELISIQKMQDFLELCDIPCPTNGKMQDLIRNLFYLDLYIRTYHKNNDSFKTRNLFFEHIWDTRIKGIPHDTEFNSIAREKTIFNMFKGILETSSSYYFSEVSQEREMLQNLKEDGVVDYDDVYKGYYFTHDIYEELVARYLITSVYEISGNEIEFHSSLHISMIMRKHYRLWLYDRLYEAEDNDFAEFIVKSITNKTINKIWKDEILITLMEFETDNRALSLLEELFNEDGELLMRSIFLLKTACKMIDYNSASSILTQEEIDSRVNLLYRYTKPSGAGWEYLIKYVYMHLTEINWNEGLVPLVYEVVSSWIKNVKHGATTKYAGIIALYLYGLFEDSKFKYRIDRDLKEKISVTILEASVELKEKLLQIFNSMLEENYLNHRHKYNDLVEVLLGNCVNSYIPCQVMPDTVIKLCEVFWKRNQTEESNDPFSPRFYDRDSIERDFGLKNSTNHDYYPTSALWTPAFMLLQHVPNKGIPFVIKFINEITGNFEASERNQEYMETYQVILKLQDGTEVTQICSHRLWMSHRGVSAGPNLLDCILMALEKWLLHTISSVDDDEANMLCEHFLRNSKSIAITSVINSVVLSFPDKLFPTACSLISLGEHIFSLDNGRLASENMANMTRGILGTSYQYDQERFKSNALPFREKSLEKVIVDYQISSGIREEKQFIERTEILYSCLDLLNESIDTKNTTLRYALNRIDLRRFKISNTPEKIIDGKKYIVLEADEDEDLRVLREKNEKETNMKYEFLRVSLWARDKFKELSSTEKYEEYETQPAKAINEMKMILDNINKGYVYDNLIESAPVYISAVLLNFFEKQLSIGEKEYCVKILEENLSLLKTTNQIDNLSNGTIAIVDSLPYLIRNANDLGEKFNYSISFSIALLLDNSREKDFYKIFSSKMWSENPVEAKLIFEIFVLLKKEFNDWIKSEGVSTESIEKFIKKKKMYLRKIFKGTVKIDKSEYSSLNYNELMETMMLLDTLSESNWTVLKKLGPPIWKVIFEDDYRGNTQRNRNYDVEAQYIFWLAKYTYHTTEKIREDLIETLESCMAISRDFESYLSHIISEHDRSKDNRIFWQIWNSLYEPIVRLVNPYKELVIKNENSYDFDGVISTYCFAWNFWGNKQKEWTGFKIQHLSFFDKVVKDLGFLPVTLEAIARFANSIGYSFTKEGVTWISTLISENGYLVHSQLHSNTIYYLEEMVLRFSKEYANDARKNTTFRENLLTILNFLVSRGSTIGFLTREELF